MSQERELPAPHNVLAVFEGLDDAHNALESLERHGVDAGDIGLIGAAAEVAEGRQDRAPSVKGPVLALVKGALVGVAIGAPLGAAMGAIWFEIVTEGRMIIGVLLGAVVGAIAGSFVGAAFRIPFSSAWQTSFEHVAGRVAVNVGSEDLDTVQHAQHVLEKTHPVEVIPFEGADFERIRERI